MFLEVGIPWRLIVSNVFLLFHSALLSICSLYLHCFIFPALAVLAGHGCRYQSSNWDISVPIWQTLENRLEDSSNIY